MTAEEQYIFTFKSWELLWDKDKLSASFNSVSQHYIKNFSQWHILSAFYFMI